MKRNPVQFQKGLSLGEFMQHYGNEFRCGHPAASMLVVDVVDGRHFYLETSCRDLRTEDGACGLEGWLFDPKPLQP